MDMVKKIQNQLELKEEKPKLVNAKYVTGDTSGIYGNASGVWGDFSGIKGDVTGIEGNAFPIMEILKRARAKKY